MWERLKVRRNEKIVKRKRDKEKKGKDKVKGRLRDVYVCGGGVESKRATI